MPVQQPVRANISPFSPELVEAQARADGEYKSAADGSSVDLSSYGAGGLTDETLAPPTVAGGTDETSPARPCCLPQPCVTKRSPR